MFQRLMRWWIGRYDRRGQGTYAHNTGSPPWGQWPIPGPNFDPMAYVNQHHLQALRECAPCPPDVLHDVADGSVDCGVVHTPDGQVVVCDPPIPDAGAPVDTGPPPSPPPSND